MPAGQPPALRQWFWPGDYDGQQFLYPHSEAAAIDQAAKQRVPEITDQEQSNLIDQGFSTAYPASSDESASTSILDVNDQPSSPAPAGWGHRVKDSGPQAGTNPVRPAE